MLRIKEIRKARKITAKELADYVKVAESTMSLYENGKREPNFDTLMKIAHYLQTSVDYLLGNVVDAQSIKKDVNTISIEIGKKIKILRDTQSLREFAQRCDISHTTIDTLEKGYDFRTGKPVQIKIATLQKIANACNVPLSYFLEEKLSKSEELKIAVFGGTDASDEMLDKVLEYAKFLKNQSKAKQSSFLNEDPK